MSYTFGKHGGIDYYDSFRRFRPFDFIRDIYRFPVEDYDLVINDFEPITAWACKLKKKKCVAFSHQAAFLSKNTPRAMDSDMLAEFLFKHYAPCSSAIGLHFEPYDSFIRTPIIRAEIRQLEPYVESYITVYLPAYTDELLIKYFEKFPDFHWEVFSKHVLLPYRQNNVRVIPIDNKAYLKSLQGCTGLLTGGGFEAPAEATHLAKKVMVIPMFNQYEQKCNAKAFEHFGGTMVTEINHNFEHYLRSWLYQVKPLNIFYEDHTERMIQELLVENNLM